jgi:hypothetical protein
MAEFLMVFVGATIEDKAVNTSLIKVIHQEYTTKLLTGKHAFDVFELMFEIIVDEATGASFAKLSQEISSVGIFDELDALSESDCRDRSHRNFPEVVELEEQSDSETENHVPDRSSCTISSVESDSEYEETDYCRSSESVISTSESDCENH